MTEGFPSERHLTTRITRNRHPRLCPEHRARRTWVCDQVAQSAHETAAGATPSHVTLDLRSSGLLERDGELDELERLVDEACAGRGRLVLVEGPPGIGKTRLLEAVRNRSRRRHMAVLAARASELDRDFPFGMARQLYGPIVAAAEEEPRARLLAGAAGPAGALGAGAARPTPPDEPQHAADPPTLFHALYWLTPNPAEGAPVAIVLDDLHWADASSLRFLQFLAPRVEELPLLVAVATRAREPGLDRRAIDALATDPVTVVLHPQPLSEQAVARLVADELGDAADERLSAACREATGGNPFLLHELVRELATEDPEPSADREALVRALAPPTVARAVLLRLARLGEEATALAQAVAVLGDQAPARYAFALAELPERRGDELATALAEADVLAAARPLAFAHPILRSAVEADMEASARAHAHQQAAKLMATDGAEPEAIAAHLLACEPAGDPQVVATLREAAARARRRGAPPVAAAWLERALAE